MKFSEYYSLLLRDLVKLSDFESAPRGKKIKERLNETIVLDDPKNCAVSWPDVREYPMEYAASEFCWYLSGRRSSENISERASLWGDIDDVGRVNSNYGRLVFYEEDHWLDGQQVSGFMSAVSQLVEDPETRRAVIRYARPEHMNSQSGDVVCTHNAHFFVRNGKLHQIVNARSSDAIFGLSFDLPWHSFVQQQVQLYLNKFADFDVELGTLKFNADSLHVYERHFDVAEEIIEEGDRGENLYLESEELIVDKLGRVEPDVRRRSFVYCENGISVLDGDTPKRVLDNFGISLEGRD